MLGVLKLLLTDVASYTNTKIPFINPKKNGLDPLPRHDLAGDPIPRPKRPAG